MSAQVSKDWRPGSLLPTRHARHTLLVFVIAALCFLASMTVIAALAADRAAKGWQAELMGSASVLVRPKPGETADAAAARATEALAGVKGVTQAAMLERQKAEALLEPWLGREVLADLPIPRLVAVELDRESPASANDLTRALAAAGVDATVDDHRLWMADVMRAGTLARIAAAGAALVLAAVAAGVIVMATRSALGAWREAVEVLHLSGAEDVFIAGLFQSTFARVAAFSAVIGAGAAIAVAAMLRLAGGAQGISPALPIAWSDLFAPLLAPLIAGLIGAIGARTATLGLLRRLP